LRDRPATVRNLDNIQLISNPTRGRRNGLASFVTITTDGTEFRLRSPLVSLRADFQIDVTNFSRVSICGAWRVVCFIAQLPQLATPITKRKSST